MAAYWLTQRLCRRTYKRDTDIGLDVNFELDYMGSSEFEWGAIPQALKNLRATADLGIHESKVNLNGVERTVYFICDKQSFQAKREAFGVWADAGFRGQERSHFPEVFAGDGGQFYDRTIAWWAIDSDVAWTLDGDVAADLLQGLSGTAVGGNRPEGSL